MFDYQSPITAQFCGSLNDEILKIYEDTAHAEINATIGFNIDKEELIKALAYDRHQYERGYQDGKAEAKLETGWISVKDRLPCETSNKWCVGVNSCGKMFSFKESLACNPKSDTWLIPTALFNAEEITHFMYLPEPPTLEGDE